MKKAQRFSFDFPLKYKAVRDLQNVTEHIGNLQVEAVGYLDTACSPLDVLERYSVDIEFVEWKGNDIKAVLEVTGFLEDIQDAAIRFFACQAQQEWNKAA